MDDGDNGFQFSNGDLARCAERELKYRRHVYPRLVDSGKMKRTFMLNEILKMEAIRDHFAKLAEGEQLL